MRAQASDEEKHVQAIGSSLRITFHTFTPSHSLSAVSKLLRFPIEQGWNRLRSHARLEAFVIQTKLTKLLNKRITRGAFLQLNN
jgi:hypothetical protein